MHRLNLNKVSSAPRFLSNSLPPSNRLTSRFTKSSQSLRHLATATNDQVLRKAPSPVDGFVNSNNSYYMEESMYPFGIWRQRKRFAARWLMTVLNSDRQCIGCGEKTRLPFIHPGTSTLPVWKMGCLPRKHSDLLLVWSACLSLLVGLQCWLCPVLAAK
jgi:hypothetical protein